MLLKCFRVLNVFVLTEDRGILIWNPRKESQINEMLTCMRRFIGSSELLPGQTGRQSAGKIWQGAKKKKSFTSQTSMDYASLYSYCHLQWIEIFILKYQKWLN